MVWERWFDGEPTLTDYVGLTVDDAQALVVCRSNSEVVCESPVVRQRRQHIERPAGNLARVRRAIMPIMIAALLAAGCGHAQSRGVVDGHFRLPGMPAADLQRGGLNFAKASEGAHGNGKGHTVRVGADGSFTATLSPGSYSVIGGLSGHPGGPAPEKCAASMNVIVRANGTTRTDYVCRAMPVTAPTP